MQNNITLRFAEISDVEPILSLMIQLGYPQDLNNFKRRFQLFTQEKNNKVVVAETKGKIIGWVAWSKNILFVSEATRIHIEGLVVDQDHRGKKVGKSLMLYVEDFAQQFNPCIIDLTSGLRREKDGSHDFYKSLGYQNEGDMAKLYLRKYV